MKMPKHSDEDKARFRDLVPEAPGVEVKPMFGSVGAFVNGNMFAGLFGTDIGVKLDEESQGRARGHRRERAVRPGGAADGRLPVDAGVVHGRARRRTWMERARDARRHVPAEGEEEVTDADPPETFGRVASFRVSFGRVSGVA